MISKEKYENDIFEFENKEYKQRLLSILLDVMEDAPQKYQDILHQYYLEELPLDQLVERELEQRATNKYGKRRTKIQARDAIYQNLKRARDWVHAKAAQRLNREMEAER